MPTYVYECEEHGIFDRVLPFDRAREPQTCEQCGAASRKRITLPAVTYSNSTIGHDATAQKRHDARLDLYRSARKQGIQPATTSLPDIRASLDISDATGVAFDAGAPR